MSTFNRFETADLDAAVAHAEPAFASLAGGSLFLTGGTGFIGQWLLAVIARANATRALGLSTTVLTRNAAAFSARCPELAEAAGVRLVEGDVRFFEYPKGRFTHVVHAATETSVDADRRPLNLVDTIVGGTRRVLEFARSADASRFLFTSSGAVYGAQPPDLASVPETYTGACDPIDRRSVYGQSKRMAEQLATIFNQEHGLQTVIARLFAFVGPGMPLDAHFAIGNFIRDAVAGRPIVLSGDGTPVRSYLYAGDLAAWLLRLLASGAGGTAYNVGSDRGAALAVVAEEVAAAVGSSQGVVVKGAPQPGAFRSQYVPCINRARTELGLDVWTPLDESIRRTARWASSGTPNRVNGAAAAVPAGHRKLNFVIDLDGVVATLTPNNDYSLALPLPASIADINRLFDAGHHIVLFTARGSASGIDWQEVTRRQLDAWGVKYHEIRFGKPAADYYIDDRMLTVSDLSSLVRMIAP